VTWRGWEDYVPVAALANPPPKAKRSKYGAEPTTVDGHRFASKREAARYQELRLLEKAGRITGLVLQPILPIHVMTAKGEPVRVCAYIADFGYTRADGADVIEDSKCVKTAVYRLKKKMVRAEYGIEIVEV
jgi:hypothetical protein